MKLSTTMAKIGMSEEFSSLETKLTEIRTEFSFLKKWASGELFENLIAELAGEKEIDNLEAYFGRVSEDISTRLNKELERAHVAVFKIRDTRQLIGTLFDRLDSMDKAMEISCFGSPEVDTAPLLQFLLELDRELAILQNLPAYYKTLNTDQPGSLRVTTKVYRVKNGDTLERIAYEVLGDADKAYLIMEYNGLTPDDVGADNWVGRKLEIPYDEPIPAKLLEYNFVLDGNGGIRALGKGLPNELLVVEDPVGSGLYGLEVLDYTDNFLQALANRVTTHRGAIPEEPEYGSLVSGMVGSYLKGVGMRMADVEVKKAILADPRVDEVLSVRVEKDDDAFSVKATVRPVNSLEEETLKEHWSG